MKKRAPLPRRAPFQFSSLHTRDAVWLLARPAGQLLRPPIAHTEALHLLLTLLRARACHPSALTALRHPMAALMAHGMAGLALCHGLLAFVGSLHLASVLLLLLLGILLTALRTARRWRL